MNRIVNYFLKSYWCDPCYWFIGALQYQVSLKLCMTNCFLCWFLLLGFFQSNFNDAAVYTQVFSYRCSVSGDIVGVFRFRNWNSVHQLHSFWMQLYYLSENEVVQYCRRRGVVLGWFFFFTAGSFSAREDFNQTLCKLQWNLLAWLKR